MPFTINIDVNGKQACCVKGHNCRNSDGENEQPERRYRYTATATSVSGRVTEGDVVHIRHEGIEKLAALILDDLSERLKVPPNMYFLDEN
jgi:hypothetical protein